MTGPIADCRGLEMTAASDLAVSRYDAFVRRFMAHGADAAPRLKAVMEADPELALGHCARGFCFLILGRHELRGAARDALAAARASLAARGGTAREHGYVSALAALCDGRFVEAGAILDRCLRACPRDGYAAKLVHALRFMLGDARGMRESTAAILPAWDEAVPDAGYVWGCHAFGLEETGDYAPAEALGRRAVAHAPDDAWGFHAVAHVMEMQDRTEAGLAWLDSDAADLSGTGNLAYHIAWHKALFLMNVKAFDVILDVYDHEIRANQTDDFRDISNAVSLLARLEGAGVDVGGRWGELVDKAAKRTDDMALAFAALHYLTALIADRRWSDVHDQLAAMHREAETGEGDQAMVFREVGLPYAEALVASHRSGPDRTQGAVRLARSLPDLPRLGGSHAQRDLFFRMAVERLEAAGQGALGRDLLTRRLAERPQNHWAREHLAVCAVSGFATPGAHAAE